MYLTMAFVAMMTIVSFSSCEDENIATDLDGIWRGNMYMQHEWDGRVYESTYSEIEFIQNPGISHSGRGYWVDYYNSYGWGRDYVYNHITWTVRHGSIYVYFEEEGTEIVIDNYTLNSRYFDGIINDNGYPVSFRLNRVTAPRNGSWDRYEYWGYSKSRSADEKPEKMPVRRIAHPGEQTVNN